MMKVHTSKPNTTNINFTLLSFFEKLNPIKWTDKKGLNDNDKRDMRFITSFFFVERILLV